VAALESSSVVVGSLPLQLDKPLDTVDARFGTNGACIVTYILDV
jgi:hypothetical protein